MGFTWKLKKLKSTIGAIPVTKRQHITKIRRDPLSHARQKDSIKQGGKYVFCCKIEKKKKKAGKKMTALGAGGVP